MTNRWRRGAALMAAVACAMAVTVAATAGSSLADDRYDEREKCEFGQAAGDGVSAFPGGIPFNDFRFDLCRTGPTTQDVRGFFAATAPLSAGVVAVSGPIICADVRDNRASLLYPLDQNSTPGLAGQQILIVATDGGPNPADDRIAFTGPAPAAAFGGQCGLDSPQAALAAPTTLPLSEGFITVGR